MESKSELPYFLTLDSTALGKALGRLCRAEKIPPWFGLGYEDEHLVIVAGNSTEQIPADGTWPATLLVRRAWAEAILKSPLDSRIVTLRRENGQLLARGFAVSSWEVARGESIEWHMEMDRRIADAAAALSPWGVDEPRIQQEVDLRTTSGEFHPGPSDEKFAADVSSAWARVARDGVKIEDVRQLLEEKSRKAWELGRRRAGPDATVWDRYGIGDEEIHCLRQRGQAAEVVFWERKSSEAIQRVANAWVSLCVFGMEPADILVLSSRTASGPESPRD